LIVAALDKIGKAVAVGRPQQGRSDDHGTYRAIHQPGIDATGFLTALLVAFGMKWMLAIEIQAVPIKAPREFRITGKRLGASHVSEGLTLIGRLGRPEALRPTEPPSAPRSEDEDAYQGNGQQVFCYT
jgi:hypothetical protein